jgi:hypothetical protein
MLFTASCPMFPHRLLLFAFRAANKARRPIGVKNLPAEDISGYVSWLRTSHAHRARRRIIATHIISKRPSIQGTWNPSTFSLVQQLQYQAQEGQLPSSSAAGQQQGQQQGQQES